MGAGLGRDVALCSLRDSHQMLGSSVLGSEALKADASELLFDSTTHWLCALEQVTSRSELFPLM